jgi:hypothetical protein
LSRRYWDLFFAGSRCRLKAGATLVRIMNRTLSDEDRRAVDLFLDQGARATKGGVTKVVSPVSQKRMASIKQVLAMLDEMPVEEPPADLVEQTMRLIDSAAGNPAAQPASRPAPVIPPA